MNLLKMQCKNCGGNLKQTSPFIIECQNCNSEFLIAEENYKEPVLTKARKNGEWRFVLYDQIKPPFQKILEIVYDDYTQFGTKVWRMQLASEDFFKDKHYGLKMLKVGMQAIKELDEFDEKWYDEVIERELRQYNYELQFIDRWRKKYQ